MRKVLGLSLFASIFACLKVHGAKAFAITPKTFDFRNHPIAYEEVTRVQSTSSANLTDTSTNSVTVNESPILVLNGFGVGSFHQHRLFPNLLSIEEKDGVEKCRKVYGIDYLGQGNSWPLDCDDGNSENEKGLIYSIDTWADQIISFIDEVIVPNHPNEKVHLIGNSVGGHLSVVLAAKRPDLIESIILLNATPVWGLNLKGWSGHLPPPFIPRKLGRVLFDWIRDLDTIEKYLEAAYSNRAAFDDDLMKKIRACTEGQGRHAAFASILFSPPASFPGDSNGFYENLGRLECDVLLLFGRDDPWCTPSFAKRMLQSLSSSHRNGKNTVHRYIELANCAHCPNHEAPSAVGDISKKWITTRDRSRDSLHLLDKEYFEEPWGKIKANEIDEENAKLSIMEKVITTFV